MTPFMGELVGTALFVLIGSAVAANLLLSRTRGESGGAGGNWIVLTTGWAMALFVGAAVAAPASGAHLNPAVTLGFWQMGRLPTSSLGVYLGGQFAGATIGAILAWLLFLPHWGRTDDPSRKLGAFATSPAIRAPLSNCFSEALATFIFVFGLLAFREAAITPAAGVTPSSIQALSAVNIELGAIGAIPMALLFWAVALGLGGTTTFAINPARDFAPRLVHALAPIPGKGSSDWGYAWVPLVGPTIGGLAAAGVGKVVGL